MLSCRKKPENSPDAEEKQSLEPLLPIVLVKGSSDQQMRDAMEAASSSGTVSANKAANMYGVPRSTLKDHHVIHGVKPKAILKRI